MKRTVTLLALLMALTAAATAQEETKLKISDGTWSTSTTPALKASEFFFDNWSKTGNSQIDITSTFFGNYKYTHPKFVWDNVADLAYGFAWQDLEEGDTTFETRRKSNDKIDFTSALSWNAYKGWGASLTGNLKTQFGNGYEYSATGSVGEATKKLGSSFFAPAYLTTALSFEYKKTDWSVSLSFLTGKTTFVCNDSLLMMGYNYGVIQRQGFDPSDPTTYSNPVTHWYPTLGSYVRAQYLKKDILPNFDLYARLELFYDYWKPENMGWKSIDNASFWSADGGLDGGAVTSYTGIETTTQEGFDRLKNMNGIQRFAFDTDLDFELKIDYRFSSHIAANLACNLKFDTDYSGMGKWGHWQIYQMAGVQVFFNWNTPKQ